MPAVTLIIRHSSAETELSIRGQTHTCIACSAAVVGGREEGDQVPLGKALEAVHDTLVSPHDHLQTHRHVRPASVYTGQGQAGSYHCMCQRAVLLLSAAKLSLSVLIEPQAGCSAGVNNHMQLMALGARSEPGLYQLSS